MSVELWNTEQARGHIRQGDYVLLDFKSATCPRCGPQLNVLERVLPEYEGRVAFGMVDVEANLGLVEEFEVEALPSILLFANGELKETLRGFNKAPIVSRALNALVE